MHIRDFAEAVRRSVRWPVLRFLNWLRVLDNIEDCPVRLYVPFKRGDADEEVAVKLDGAAGSVPLCHARLAWRSANGAWHEGPDAYELLAKRVRDRNRYHDKIFINATLDGRLVWRRGGRNLSNCRIVLSDT